jgi:hypothetical protein
MKNLQTTSSNLQTTRDVFKILDIKWMSNRHPVKIIWEKVRAFNKQNKDFCAICTTKGYQADNCQIAIESEKVAFATFSNDSYTVSVVKPENWLCSVEEGYAIEHQPLAYRLLKS